MDGEELLEIDHPIAVLVEILEGLRDEDGRAALRADLGKDEVLELVLGQNLQKKQRSGASVPLWPKNFAPGCVILPSRNLRHTFLPSL